MQRLYYVMIIFLGFHGDLGAVQRDTVAYATGNLIAEITVSSWIHIIKSEKEIAFSLSKKLPIIADEYSSVYNFFFVQGIMDCLYKKNIEEEAHAMQLSDYETAMLLTCYYCWLSQLTQIAEVSSYDCHENYSESAIKKAVVQVYGSWKEEIGHDIDSVLKSNPFI